MEAIPTESVLPPADSRAKGPGSHGTPVVAARRGDPGWETTDRVLLLVADPDIRAGSDLDRELAAAGLGRVWCRDGAEALVEFGRQRPDAVLVAPRLEGVDTATVVRTLHEAGSQPILVGLGVGDLEEAGRALVAGAAGVVSRPYVAGEIVARLEPVVQEVEQRSRVVYGPLEVDPWAYRVRVGDVVWENLPLKEFELLRLLVAHADHVVTPEQIRCALWGGETAGPTSNAVTVHVGRLRARLAGVAELRTVRGLGYRLTVPPGG